MSLRERLGAAHTGFGVPTEMADSAPTDMRAYQAVKVKIHQLLLQRIDLERTTQGLRRSGDARDAWRPLAQ